MCLIRRWKIFWEHSVETIHELSLHDDDDKMKIASIVILIYGIISLAGGIYGYAAKQSAVSLAAGGASGIIMIVCGFAVLRRVYPALYVAIIVALILAVHFGLSFSRAPKLMPAGLMLVMSLLTIGFSVYALSQRE